MKAVVGFAVFSCLVISIKSSPVISTKADDLTTHEVPTMLKACSSTLHCHCVQGLPMCHNGQCVCLFAIQLGHDGNTDSQQTTELPMEPISEETETTSKEPQNGSEI
uniref:Uncharacterized protein LOC111132823 n=1 Tax=Crassostrea virginica TaxID=6565 RepID=A0A8B8E6X9_CRAVI|nr:uncharacterized protein LOC111132823 [Crassostrea virginica]